MWRQVGNAASTFVVVLASNLLVYEHVPWQLDEWWQPLLQAIVATGGVYGVNKGRIAIGGQMRAGDRS